MGDTAVAEDLGRTSAEVIEPAERGPKELVGATLAGRYLVTRKIGQGGMGAVYEATHTLINKQVAVKVLLEKYAQREAVVKRLAQEAQLASSLKNEHIIDITDFGSTDDGRTFVVMEYLQGESLAERLVREPKLPEHKILDIAAQAASALAAAHAKDIVHRDIKPENLFLLERNGRDFVKVVDFGISKSLRASDEEPQPRLTQTGMVLGTPLYMSPEQARGDEDLDARVDIYALGVIMYEAATGRVPFTGTNYLSVISQVLNESPAPPRELRPDLTEEFEAIVLRAMAKDRDERYASADEMLADLTALLDDPMRSTERAKITPPRTGRRTGLRKWGPIAGGVAGVVAIVWGAVALLQRGHTPPPPLPPPQPQQIVQAPPPVDAAPRPVIDVGPRTVELNLTSIPRGAKIVGADGVVYCAEAPCANKKLVVHDQLVLTAQLAGYDDLTRTVPVADLAVEGAHDVEFDLKKTAKAPPPWPRPVHHVVPRPPVNPTGGELTGPPPSSGGTVPGP